MSNQADQLALFIDLTGATEDRAKFFLESSGWQLEVAVASFFETENDNEMDPDSPEVLEQVTNPPERFVPEPQPPPQSRPSGTKKSKSKSKSYSSSSNRVRTLASYRQESDSEDSGNEEGQAFYAGGSDSSGQQILGPSKNKNRGDKEDLVAQMFKSVQEHGAEVVDPNAPPSAGPSNSFGGRGYRLGQTPDDIEEVTGGGPSRQAPQVEVTLRMWREGFTVNDGPLKKYSDPENKEFLECIRKGEVPRELVREARGSEVHVNIENKSHEDPGPYKPKVKAFAGKGNVLGSPVPSSVATDVSVAPTDPKSKEEAEEAAKQQVSVDASQPSTTIQVRLTDGSTIVARLNHSHTVADLRRYITVARPQYAAAPFSLHTTFPRKELSDDSQSVQAAGLLNAAVLQRLG